MLVRVEALDAGGLAEWAIVELQGKVESTSGREDAVTDIGMLQLSPVVRCMGNHRMMKSTTSTLVARLVLIRQIWQGMSMHVFLSRDVRVCEALHVRMQHHMRHNDCALACRS